MENEVLRAANYIKYVVKKKPSPIKILNYLQNNGASNYDLPCSENKLRNIDVMGY